VNINAKTKDGRTALHAASSEGHLDVVQALLENGVDVSAKTKDGWTALHVASSEGHLDVVQALLLAKGVDIDAKTNDGNTALEAASSNGRRDIVEELLEKGADLNAYNRDGWTAFHVASLEGHLDVVQTLLERGADVNAKTADTLSTALHMATRGSHLDIVQALLAKGADVAPEAMIKIGRLFQNNGNFNSAISCYKSAIGANVDEAATLVIEGLLKMAQDSDKRDIKLTAYNEASQIGCPEADWQMYRLFKDTSGEEKAENALLKAIKGGHRRAKQEKELALTKHRGESHPTTDQKCPDCNGKGSFISGLRKFSVPVRRNCSRCNGTGFIPRERDD
jgi:ankyrin repeat protein